MGSAEQFDETACSSTLPAEYDYCIALAGNPNVGKSTVFNALTGMHQHTGNWAGKTVTNAVGTVKFDGKTFLFNDLPGTYSLRASSPEEAVARDAIAFGAHDAVVVVCDACCLERNLHLVLQIMELTSRVLLCVNLLDEAEKKGICTDLSNLEEKLGIPVVGIIARSRIGLDALMLRLQLLLVKAAPELPPPICYDEELEHHLQILTRIIEEADAHIPARWAALQCLSRDVDMLQQLFPKGMPADLAEYCGQLPALLSRMGWTPERVQDSIIAAAVTRAETLAAAVTSCACEDSHRRDRALDRIFLGKHLGVPIMLLLLAGILWLTMVGANYPSAWLSEALFSLGNAASGLLLSWGAPAWLEGLLIQGIYRVLAWVVSVMLPPMAIFFPLFTLLEDAGYLPRAAFNLDSCFRRAGACGKQALTMCMGFGCNAAGVTGCRIIDSPRERLIAILTNCLVPCNGRFPMMISLITMFFVTGTAFFDSILSALMLLGVIIAGVLVTFLMSKFLSATFLRGTPSSFTLELPPYRRPQIGKVLVRSVFDRTVFVLGRACMISMPAGALIWLLANISTDSGSLLSVCAGCLDPFAQWLGMDGAILLAFLLAFPANEIVIPIILMIYLSQGSLVEITELSTLHSIFVENGWTWVTALCTMTFSLLHFPCSTTCLTIYKETGSKRWTLLAVLLPTLTGMLACFLIHSVSLLL